MSYTDAEMLMATQVAYLNVDGNGRDMHVNVGDLVDAVLKQYGRYDASTGTYALKEGIDGIQKQQFETAQNIVNLSEQNNTVSWRHWTITDTCSREDTSGYYSCLIDTGDGNAIVGTRGSESYDSEQVLKDWVAADALRMNNELTDQQADATRYMEYIYKKYGDRYEHFSLTGHSLGGSLSTHSAISAPEGMQDKIDQVISFDGPGFSDEYLKKYEGGISRVRNKLTHYEYSWVGSLLNQPKGIHNRIIKAHDDQESSDVFLPQLVRHHTRNIEFDANGNVQDGERGFLQTSLSLISKTQENAPWVWQFTHFKSFLLSIMAAYIFSVGEQVLKKLSEVVETVKEKANELYNAYLSLSVSGNYEVHMSEIGRMMDDLERAQRNMDRIADQVREIKRDLPYDSISAFYYKSLLGSIASGIESEGRKADKISRTVDRAVHKYNQGDQEVSSIMPPG